MELLASLVGTSAARAARAVRDGVLQTLASPAVRAMARAAVVTHPELAAARATVRSALSAAAEAMPREPAAVCALPGCGCTRNLKRCARCSTLYCSGQHQAADWELHKHAGRATAAAAAN